jgi:hypothetical protein
MSMSTTADRLDRYLAAEAEVLEFQSASFEGRTLTRANLPEITKKIEELEAKIAAENARAVKAPTIGGLSYSVARLDG